MNKTGFINNSSKKLFAGDRLRNCAYIYTDGIVLSEYRTFKSGKLTTEKSIAHIFPCSVPIHIYHTHTDKTKFEGRIVVHNPSLLIDGLVSVNIYYHNQSSTMIDKGIFCDTVTLITQRGMKIHEDIFSFLSSELVPQNQKKMTIMNWDYDSIWHGEKPSATETTSLE